MPDPKDVLKAYFKYPSFKGKQEEIINRLLKEDGHCLVLMPTGGGKSICYQVPALIFDGGTILISPLKALKQDQVDALKRKHIPAEFNNTTVKPKARI